MPAAATAGAAAPPVAATAATPASAATLLPFDDPLLLPAPLEEPVPELNPAAGHGGLAAVEPAGSAAFPPPQRRLAASDISPPALAAGLLIAPAAWENEARASLNAERIASWGMVPGSTKANRR